MPRPRSRLRGVDSAVTADCAQHYILRVCGLFGRAGSSGKGGNFVETMLRKAAAGQALRVVNGQVLRHSLSLPGAANHIILRSQFSGNKARQQI